MPSVPFLGFILHLVAGHLVYLIAVRGNTSIRNTSYRCVKRTSPRESDRLQVGQALSSSLFRFENSKICSNRVKLTNLVMIGVKIRVMVFNAIFNNISVISLRSVLLVEETGVPEENH